jgi:hypothetical protein
MFRTEKSAKGNVGVSLDSMKKAMDALNCTGCNDCTDCTRCIGCEKQPIQIIGLAWIVTIRQNDTIKIGCEDHSREFWVNATDSEISYMESRALNFWSKYKELILNFPSLFKVI